jgi:zinc and cadmium transporter
MEITYALIASFFIMSASLSGVFFLNDSGKKFIEKYHHHILAFSIGILSVVLYSLFVEGLEHMESPTLFGIGALLGAASLVVISRFLKHPEHHHHGNHSHKHERIDGNHVLISDSVHNISDGLILVPAFAAGPLVGIGTTLAVLIHEAVSEIAEFFVLKESGMTDKEALTRNFISSGSIVIGVIVSFFVSQVEILEPWLFAVSAGAFTYLIFVDLLPCIFSHRKNTKEFSQYLIMILVGIAVMLTIQNALPHGHEEEHGEESSSAISL